MIDLMPFETPDVCPMCNHGEVSYRYVKKKENDTEEEYIRVTCGKCGYFFNKETANAS